MELKEVLEKIALLQSTIEGTVQKQKEAEAAFKAEQDADVRKKTQEQLDKYKADLEGLQTLQKDYGKMKTSLEEATKKNDVLRLEAKTGRVDSFLKDLKTEGKLLPSFEGEAKALLMQSSEEDKLGKFSKIGEEGTTSEAELSQFEAFQNLLNKLPKLVDFKEKTPGKTKEEEVSDKEIKLGEDTFQLDDVELEAAVKKYMSENKTATYTEALVEVSSQFKKEGKEQGLSTEA